MLTIGISGTDKRRSALTTSGSKQEYERRWILIRRQHRINKAPLHPQTEGDTSFGRYLGIKLRTERRAFTLVL